MEKCNCEKEIDVETAKKLNYFEIRRSLGRQAFEDTMILINEDASNYSEKSRKIYEDLYDKREE